MYFLFSCSLALNTSGMYIFMYLIERTKHDNIQMNIKSKTSGTNTNMNLNDFQNVNGLRIWMQHQFVFDWLAEATTD